MTHDPKHAQASPTETAEEIHARVCVRLSALGLNRTFREASTTAMPLETAFVPPDGGVVLVGVVDGEMFLEGTQLTVAFRLVLAVEASNNWQDVGS